MLEFYNVKNDRLKEIEPDYEQYFGLIIDMSTLCQLVPEFDIETEELKYGTKKVLENYESTKIPLICQNVGGVAKEVLTGVCFALQDCSARDFICNSSDTFYDWFDGVKEEPLILTGERCYELDGQFKKMISELYRIKTVIAGEDVTLAKDDIADILLDLRDRARKNFDKALETTLDDSQDIAYVDNMIFDYEKKLKLEK